MVENYVLGEIRRSDFILLHWRNDFPNVKHLEWDEIASIISRSEALQDWYFKKLESMKVLVEMPSWARDVMSIKEFDTIRNDILGYSNALAKLSQDISNVAIRRNEEVKDLRKDFDVKWQSTLQNAHIFIFTLNSSKLPVRILMEIENYEPSKEGDLTKSQFARLKLDSFKKKLFDLHSQGINVFDYVRDEALKF